MELRSGAVTGVELPPRPAASQQPKVDPRWCLTPQVGESHGSLGSEPGPYFEKGIAAIMQKWTAFRLAVDNGWGGQNSEEKAAALEDEVIHWFYKGKGPLYADELEDLLMEAMQVDFNTECEDGSPKEVSVKMVALYTQMAKGNYSYVDHLVDMVKKVKDGHGKSVKMKRSRNADGSASNRQTVEGESDDSSDSSDDEDGPQTWTHGADTEELPSVEEEPPKKPEPVIDEDGFELVQKPRRRKR